MIIQNSKWTVMCNSYSCMKTRWESWDRYWLFCHDIGVIRSWHATWKDHGEQDRMFTKQLSEFTAVDSAAWVDGERKSSPILSLRTWISLFDEITTSLTELIIGELSTFVNLPPKSKWSERKSATVRRWDFMTWSWKFILTHANGIRQGGWLS